MRGTPFTKHYSGPQQKLWDRFDRLPPEFRKMVADDPNGDSPAALEAAEELAREAGLLPPLKEKEEDKKEDRSTKDRARTEAAKERSRIVYYAPAGTPSKKHPPAEKVVKVSKQRLQSKSEHNSE